jgi:hypothetical protein
MVPAEMFIIKEGRNGSGEIVFIKIKDHRKIL